MSRLPPRPPGTEAKRHKLKKELTAGSQEAADALCFSGHLDLLSDEQKADLAGRLGPGGHARIFPPAPEAEREPPARGTRPR